jgi:hypothetical protein
VRSPFSSDLPEAQMRSIDGHATKMWQTSLFFTGIEVPTENSVDTAIIDKLGKNELRSLKRALACWFHRILI